MDVTFELNEQHLQTAKQDDVHYPFMRLLSLVKQGAFSLSKLHTCTWTTWAMSNPFLESF